jgi:hypothetical protein
MFEARRKVRLAQEAAAKSLVVRELGSEDLERHTTSRTLVFGEVDGAHGALPEQRVDPERADSRPDLDLVRHLSDQA